MLQEIRNKLIGNQLALNALNDIDDKVSKMTDEEIQEILFKPRSISRQSGKSLITLYKSSKVQEEYIKRQMK